MLTFRNEIHIMLVRIANSEQSALGLQCLSRPFRQATRVQYFSKFTVIFTFVLENVLSVLIESVSVRRF